MENRAKEYARIKYKLAVIDIVYTLVLLIVLQMSGLAVRLANALTGLSGNQFVLTALYSAVIFLMYMALNYMFDFYRSFVVEHRFGLTKQKFSPWLADHLKSNALGLVVFVILMESFLFLARSYPQSWWWMSALFWIFLSVLIAKIFPVIVIPIFFKCKKLENEDLRRRILSLAKAMRVRILDVFEIDFSKKSLKANAAFVGMGKSKRVLLTDTLLNGKFLPEEIEMILAHEFAHYRFKHLIKMVIMNSFIIFLTFYIFFQLDKHGLQARDISNLGTWIFLFMILQLLMTPVTNLISRIMERNADIAAIQVIGKRGSFISMMEKLGEQNLADRTPPLWVKIFFYDHPPIGERIEYSLNTEER